LRGPQARLLTRLHAIDLFFDGAEAGFSSPAQFFFLRSLARFCLKVTALFFGAAAALFFFGLSKRC
jgi:hypothetical protein